MNGDRLTRDLRRALLALRITVPVLGAFIALFAPRDWDKGILDRP